VAYSFLANLVGSVVKGNDWLRDSSLFTHIALAPASRPDWFQAAVLVLLGLGGAALGAVAFQRRDVAYT
jgi:putative exporter of polyketide antibiotics